MLVAQGQHPSYLHSQFKTKIFTSYCAWSFVGSSPPSVGLPSVANRSTRNQILRSLHSHLTIKNISGQTRLTTSNARIEVLLLKASKLTWFRLSSNFPSAVHILLQKLRSSIAATHSSTANKCTHPLPRN